MSNPAFWPAYRVIPWVVLGYFARFLYFFPVSGMLFTKRTAWTPVATLVAAAVNIGLNIWLTPIYGIMAAAVNTFIGFLVLLLIVFIVGQRIYPIRYEYRRLAQIMLFSLALFAAGWWLAPDVLWPSVALKSLLVAALPVLLWATGFFTTAERRRIRQVAGSLRRRLS
jgi:O-antigen/teichoic acid export membrane protein